MSLTPNTMLGDLMEKARHAHSHIDDQYQKTGVYRGKGEKDMVLCYASSMMTTGGIWRQDDPFQYTVPLFLIQCIIIIAVTQSFQIVSRRLGQPKFLADVIGGILLGPSLLGRIPTYSQVLFPARSVAAMESFSDLGLLYFMFIVGLQLEPKSVFAAGRRAWALAVSGFLLSFLFLSAALLATSQFLPPRLKDKASIVFLGVSVSVTAYPVLVRILAKQKLLHNDVGRLAMSAALINAGIAWALFAAASGLAGKGGSLRAAMESLPSGAALFTFIYLVTRPLTRWAEEKAQESGSGIGEAHVVVVLVAVLACGIAGDAVGMHSVLGAFALGVAMPCSGRLATTLMEKLEDFVIGFMMPVYFAVVGLKVEIQSLKDPKVYMLLITLILLSAAARLTVTYVVCGVFSMSPRESLTVGVLMNTKGILEVVVLRMALEKKVLDRQAYTIMILTSLFLTFIVSPLVYRIYRPPKDYFASYKRRMLEGAHPELDLRVVSGVHSIRNVPALVSLLDLTYPTRRTPVSLYAVQLVELTARESAILVVNDTANLAEGAAATSRFQHQLEQIARAFHEYEQRALGLTVQALTLASPYSSMHEDVCSLAEDKHAALLVLPYHKHHAVDGTMEVIHPGIQTFNSNVLAAAPCSVAILVDRGLGSARMTVPGVISRYVAVLFIGGPDDREALALAGRMAENPSVGLTVIRFVDANWKAGIHDTERERDNECVREFRVRSAGEERVVYTERPVANGIETVAAIRAIDVAFDLYVIGRSDGVDSPLTAGMTDWAESPELGAVGDLLCSSDFTATVSLLVVQQYRGGADGPGSPSGMEEGFMSMSRGMRSSSRDKGVGWDP